MGFCRRALDDAYACIDSDFNSEHSRQRVFDDNAKDLYSDLCSFLLLDIDICIHV